MMRVFIKSLLIVLCIMAAALAGVIVKKFRPGAIPPLLRLCSHGILRVVGVRCAVRGALAKDRPLLLVTNHTSYLDIYVLGAHVPVRFTPKAEIARWPIIGPVCRLIDSVFIDRRPSQTAENQRSLRDALQEGAVVCLFPEGTTGDGKRVLPFRSSYFSLAEESFGGAPLKVQPAAVVYTHVCGMPVESGILPQIAWYGDMELLPHLKDLLRLGVIHAELIFGEPVDITAFSNRKALAAHCQKAVETAFERARRPEFS